MSTKLFLLLLLLSLPPFGYAPQISYGDEDYEEAVGEEDYSAFFGMGKSAKKEEQFNENRGPKMWDHWGKWSDCTVTCGVGKMIRWRHCVGGSCEKGEKEAQIKSCTLPAC